MPKGTRQTPYIDYSSYKVKEPVKEVEYGTLDLGAGKEFVRAHVEAAKKRVLDKVELNQAEIVKGISLETGDSIEKVNDWYEEQKNKFSSLIIFPTEEEKKMLADADFDNWVTELKKKGVSVIKPAPINKKILLFGGIGIAVIGVIYLLRRGKNE